MADKLGKSYRIDDRRHVKDGSKIEVWTKGRHKYIVHQLDPKGIKAPATDTITYIDREKISASLTDDEVINLWLEECKKIVEFNGKNKISNPNIAAWKIIQNPYEEIPPKKRVYGETPYYLNNGCSVEIKWMGRIPNPGFDIGTFSNPKEADYMGAPVDRYLSNQPITSSVDDAKNKNTLMPVSTWTIAQPFQDGIDANSNPFFTEANYKDKPTVYQKEVKVNLPEGIKEEGEYLVWTGGGLQYNNKALPTSDRNGRSDLRISNFNDYDEDSRILEIVIAKFKRQVADTQGINDYRLGLCEPSTETCKLLEYKSPLQPKPADPPNTPIQPISGTPSVVKVPLNVDGLEDGQEIKALSGISFEVWVGQKEEISVLDGEELDDEYLEGAFSGEEEQRIVLLNEVLDNPSGPSPGDYGAASEDGTIVNAGSSTPGPGPIKGSKLTNKSGSQMINLAGHRLTLILNDLQKHLNANGFPGSKIGNNGVMRDLYASAYPNSPLRAAASFHGAGLAIDVTFSIPGYNWKSIYDNEVLAVDARLTQVISSFVKSQGDITWGAQWGKGSNPSSGIVNGRGVDEYHHFEIRSDKIAQYWEPVKDELAKFGFTPNQLNQCGRNSNLHKLMRKLLGENV